MSDIGWANPKKETTYTLIAYQPSSSRHEGCHCHGTTQHFDSNFEMTRGLTFEQLAEKMAKIRASIGSPGNDENTAEYEFTYFDDLGPPDWDEWDRNHFDDTLEALIQKQEPMIRLAREEAAKKAKEKAEREEKERRAKADAEERERRDRAEFERLKTKFTPKESR